MGLLLHTGSFAVAYAAASDLFNLLSVYWLHHYDPKWTQAGNVAIFRHLLPLMVAVACASCSFGALPLALWLDTHIKSSIASGAASGVLAATSLFVLTLALRPGGQTAGVLTFLVGPAVISHTVIRAARRHVPSI